MSLLVHAWALGDDPPATHFRSHPDLGPASETWAGFFHFEDAARRYFANGMLTIRNL